MEIIEIKIAFPGGLTITDSATWREKDGQVYVSERLKQVLRELDTTEAPPAVTATCRGQSVSMEPTSSGDFRFKSGLIIRQLPKGVLAQFGQIAMQPSKDQRQQIGRFLHTLSAGATIGAIGFWHSTTQWSLANDFSVGSLCIAAVILFYFGIVSMDGE
ncbi:hypothetical protein SB783_34815 [Paraburkholderia sp. SIMBA_009]|uniref:Uncharacterized protein n=1 Tax=Paraburkholderia tropica TaxID=92647 RepID=A0ABX5MBL2_9BURK|nr:hypothetical protein [Paraburkholderia tropica]PXX05039.1 hypothetical protein C7400_1445 [Paraburkholderia tropica]PZW70467.1 hypothetical protein C7399_1445 [Paraburkholderia tropica]